MKTCPFCAEPIQDAAIKCKHCHEFLDGSGVSRAGRRSARQRDELPWYFTKTFMVLTFVTLPPCVLPSVWFHPRMHVGLKVLITLVVAGFCWISYTAMNRFVHQFDEATRMLEEMRF